jgi:hypothetical protein
VLDESHPAVSRPAALGVEADDVLVVRVRVRRKIPLDEIPRLVGLESEEDVDSIDVSGLGRARGAGLGGVEKEALSTTRKTYVESDRMPRLGGGVSELEEVVWELRRSGHLTRSLQTEDEEIL